MKLHTKILLGLVVGALVGLGANAGLGGDHPAVEAINTYIAGPVGQVFLRLLYMIVMPLVFASIALGVAGIGDIRRVGRVGGKTLAYFLVTTALAATVGLIAVSIWPPGAAVDEVTRAKLIATYASEAASKGEQAAAGEFSIGTLVEMIVTSNPLKAAVDGNMIGVIFFGLMFGAALTLIRPDRARPMIGFLEALNDVVVKIVEIAMKLAPYGVTGLIFGVTSRFGFELLSSLGLYVAVVLGALAFHALVTLALIVRFGVGMSPIKFFTRIAPAIVTAFSTSSSSATLPTNLSVAQRNLGVPSRVAGFVFPLGATMCMNGTSLFEGITVIFLCQVFGIDLTLTQMIIVVAMSVITAVGAAAVPGGSIPLVVGILAMFGVPGEGIALVLGVDRILDMSRTTVNIIGDHTAATFIGRLEGVWSPAKVPAEPGLDSGAELDDSPGWPTGDEADPWGDR